MPDDIKKLSVPKILAVDDETGVLESLRAIFADDYRFFSASSAAAADKILEQEDIQLVILDLGLPDRPGLQLLQQLKANSPETECIVLTAETSLASGIQAMKLGAYDYLTKPFDVDQLILVAQKALEKNRLVSEVRARRQNAAEQPRLLVGESAVMQKVYELINQVAQTDAVILITGESGTGKELVARSIHHRSPRADAPFIAVNCGAMPAELVESELFGHEKGSFTGAYQQKIGKFELAQHGTIFLDEISTLPLNLQTKLLRVLQELVIERVGGTRRISLDVHVIAATNVDLKEQVAAGKFRNDLYYRLNVVPINLPPLRERRSDIPLLVAHFLAVYNPKYHRRLVNLPERVIDYFLSYHWPGNVRELENLIQRLLVITAGDERIALENLPPELYGKTQKATATPVPTTLKEAVEQLERQLIENALIKNQGCRATTARQLGIVRTTLVSKIKKLSINVPEAPPPDLP